jgi:hypothetical protein
MSKHNHDMSPWDEHNNNKKYKHINRIKQYLKDVDMNTNDQFDEFMKRHKSNISKQDWHKMVEDFQDKLQDSGAVPGGMVVIFEKDYEHLLEMRGFFKMNNYPEYVTTIDKILASMRERNTQ